MLRRKAPDESASVASKEPARDSPDASSGKGAKDDSGSPSSPGSAGGASSKGASASSMARFEIPEELPVVPVLAITRHPLFPKFIKVIEVVDKDLQKLILRKIHFNQPYVGVFLRKNDSAESELISRMDDVYDIGSFCVIHELEEVNDRLKMVVSSVRRIKLVNPVLIADAETLGPDDAKLPPISDKDKMIIANTANVKPAPFEMSNEIRALGYEVIQAAREIMSRNPLYRDIFQVSAIRGQVFTDNPDHLSDLGAVLSTAESSDLQAVLAEMDIKKRLELSLSLLKKEVEIMRLQQKISEEVEEKIKTHNRKFLLQEQMKIIKRELGLEKDEKTSIVDKLRSRMDEAVKIPDNVKTVIDEELSKLSSLDPQSAEFNVTRNYLDWLTVLPWGYSTTESLDLAKARQVLDEDHYGMEDVKKRILEFIAVSKLSGSVQGKILCFVGPPGVGKTSIGKSIARALNRKYYRFSVGGLSDVAEIKGHRRTYVGAMPGKLIQCLKKVGAENPLVLIDEIDKIGRAAYHGDPSSALLEMLDPEQNASFLDHYLDVTVDLSKVLFICTANVVDTIPEPLKDRMEIIQLSGYIAEEKLAIAKNYLIPMALKESGIAAESVAFSDNTIDALNKLYSRESGVRGLQKNINKIMRKVAMALVEDSNVQQPIQISQESLPTYLGKPIFNMSRMYDVTPPGVVTGLAWTALGGSVLYIESAIVPGVKDKPSRDFLLTGNMGDVMKESASIAFSYAKSFLHDAFPDNHQLTENLIHLHVPEGATPKDGPSAGCTIVTALVSLALNRPVKQNVAMTGELSLKGKILAVGGVKEKVIAAKRSGIKTLLVPKDNVKDFDELPEHIRADLGVHFVENYRDIFRIVF